MDYIILTFPRSGSNYLRELIKQKLRDPNNPDIPIEIPKTHLPSEADGKKVISIIRDPFETMKSLITLALSFPDDPQFTVESGEIFKFPANEYMNTYSYIIDNSDLIIDYNDLISRPNDVLDLLAKSMNLVINKEEYINQLVDSTNHLVSSKTSKLYNTINYLQHLPGNGLSFACMNYYKRALKKTLKFI
jgi:hypothetical protein